MSRAAVLALAAACSAPGAPRTVPPAPAAPQTAPVPAAPPAAPVVHTDAEEGGIEAPPAGAVRQVAATPDGGAALTSDDLHGARLWPALDGSQEPRIVALPEAHALALGRRGDGFAAAVIDVAGGLTIATLDAAGRSRSHVSLAADPEFLGVAVAARGFVTWRADQSVVLLDADGAPLVRLATEPGERIVAVAAADAHVVVLLDHDGKRGVRTVALDKPAWSPWIDVSSDTADLVAIAPSGRFAVRDGSTASVYDPAGKLLNRLPGAAGDSLVFVDDTHLAASNGKLVWLPIGAASWTSAGANSPIVAGGGRVIAASNADVMIATPADTRYLGYDLSSAEVAQAIGGGQLVIGSLDKFATLDAGLRTAGPPRIPVRDRVVELHWLEGDTWAVESGINNNDEADFRIVAGGKARVVRDRLVAPCMLGYEPSTHLLTLSLGDTPTVYRYDPAKHDVVRVAEDPEISQYFQTELFPLRAGGQLLRVRMGNDTTIEWLPDAAKLDRPSATVKLTGSLAGADAVGTAYAWVSTATGMELAVYRDGKRIGSLPADGPVSVWPDPAGKRVVEIATHGVSLVTADGKRVWDKQIEHPTSAVWLSDGALAIITAVGIVRLDPATGKALAVRCGWGFGFASEPHVAAPAIEPVCSQLERGD